MAQPLIPANLDYHWDYTITPNDQSSYRIKITRTENLRAPVDALVAFIAERLLKELAGHVTVEVAPDSRDCVLLGSKKEPFKINEIQALVKDPLKMIQNMQHAWALEAANGDRFPGDENGFISGPLDMR